MARQNCWEYMKCGREPGGDRIDLLDVCPAPLHLEADGMNHGYAAGRFCWTVEGTLCPGVGTDRMSSCLRCPFLQEVAREEGADFTLGVGTSCRPEADRAAEVDDDQTQGPVRCRPFEELVLRHDENDPRGPGTVRAYRQDGRQVGVLRGDVAREIIDGLKEGYTYSAFVKNVPAGAADQPADGLELLIMAKDPDVEGLGA